MQGHEPYDPRCLTCVKARGIAQHRRVSEEHVESEAIGAAERAVRRLKESLGVLRADLNEAGLDVRMSTEGMTDVLRFLALQYNHFGKSRGSNMSPLEVACGRTLSKPASTLFGATVLAQLPSSVRQWAPNETRAIEAAFIHVGMGDGPLVQGYVRIDGQRQLRRFHARNVRAIEPLAWDTDLVDSSLIPQLPPEGPRGHLQGQRDQPLGSKPSPELNLPFPKVDLPSKGGIDKEMMDHEIEMDYEPESPYEPPVVHPTEEKAIPVPVGEGRQRVSKRPLDSKSSSSSQFFTRHCPSCESGMNAPGIRHTRACREKRERLTRERLAAPPTSSHVPSSEPSPPTPMAVDLNEQSGSMNKKRPAEVDPEALEKEMQEEHMDEDLQCLQLGLFQVADGMALSNFFHDKPVVPSLVSRPEFFDESINSIRFFPHNRHEKKEMVLGGSKVLVWRPDEFIDDTTLAQLDPNQGFAGMCEELANLEQCKTGILYDEAQVNNMRKSHPATRVISSRWVAAYKSPVRVRARIVAKDLKTKTSARELGFSSPTPTTDGLYVAMSIAGKRDWRLRALDVAHAFMHSPLPKGVRIVLKLPQSISDLHGNACFLLLKKALNGLRDASMHWLNLLGDTIQKIGIFNDELEPCIHQGAVYQKGKLLGKVVMVVYVDDILLCSSSPEAEALVMQEIGRVVPTKATGLILPSGDGGGTLQFIGRTIERRSGSPDLFVYVEPSYLDSTFESYGIKHSSSSTAAAPDLASHLEKTDASSLAELSDEVYGKFRRALGKLLWLGQTRMDMKVYLSLLGTKQAEPTFAAEQALRAVLRFLRNDGRVALRFPSPALMAENPDLDYVVHVFADASHAPYRFNGRKGISGQAVYVNHCLVRAASKQQQAVALSSC